MAPKPDQTTVVTAPPWRQALPRLALRLAVIAVVALGFKVLLSYVHVQLGEMKTIGAQPAITGLLVVALIGYAVMIALPYVPGVEVGIALLMLDGAAVAPFVYLATVIGLLIAFETGKRIPLTTLQNLFRDLHLIRAAQLVGSVAAATPQQRLDRLAARLPRALGPMTVKYRYVAIGVLINLPGTVVIGGGGGILLLTGMTRLFTSGGMFLTLLLAVLPVPLMVWITGTTFFT